MKYNKLVSVVMPVHNGEKYLREAIESVLNQTYANFEFLIIENCSTDSSIEIINSYSDTRIRVIVEEECGIVQAYNRGFKEAKGEYIVVHDHDDVSFTDRIEEQLKFVILNNLDLCGSSFEIVNEHGMFIKQIFPPKKKEKIIERIFFDFFAFFNPTFMIKRELIELLGYFDLDYPIGTDYDFLLKSLKDYRCGNTPNILLKYRVHDSNTSSKDPKAGEKIVQVMALKYFDNYRTLFHDANYILARLYYFYGNYLTSSKFMVKSIMANGLNILKIKYLLFSTVFVLPIFLLRKRGLFYNKTLNKLFNLFKISFNG
ncbi:MAG: glycosyltransferase [Ignavibacteriae bacterium]|nr:glycosyltransferase [Ignavibacteriota bacterium]